MNASLDPLRPAPSGERSKVSLLNDRFSAFARLITVLASSPAATAFAFSLVVAWALLGPHFHYSDFWQLIMNTASSIITFLMVFVLNNAQNRDTVAINAKLDSIIFALKKADNRLIGLERQPESTAKAVLEGIQQETEREIDPSR